MKIKDLKTGMRVVIKHETSDDPIFDVYVVLRGCFKLEIYDDVDIILAGDNGFMTLNGFGEETFLRNVGDDARYRIVEVHDSPSAENPSKMLDHRFKGELLWSREQETEQINKLELE